MAAAPDGTTVKVRFLPSGRQVELTPGMTLLDAALAADLPVGNSCGADGTCGRCGLRVVTGTLPVPSERERTVANANRLADGLRLSCMIEPDSDVEVTADYW